MRHFFLTALALSLGFASTHANQSQEKKPMNVKRITPVLLVNEIEPVIPFWVDRLGFAKTIEVPDGNKLAFVTTFQKGAAEVMLPNLRQRGKRRAAIHVRRSQKRPHVSLYRGRQFRRRPRRHERRENRHARAHRLLRYEGIRRSGARGPFHHFRAAGCRASAIGVHPSSRLRLNCH